MRFIKLTEIVNEKRKVMQERYFNVDKIETIFYQDIFSQLYTSAEEFPYKVKETPEEIIELIKNSEEI